MRTLTDEMTNLNYLIHGRMALTEEQAAELLDVNPVQSYRSPSGPSYPCLPEAVKNAHKRNLSEISALSTVFLT